MDREKRRKIAAIVIIILVIILSALYFLWGTLIDYGKVSISADAPFSVEEFAGAKYDCPESPCVIELRAGETSLILRKDGFEPMVQTLKVPIASTAELPIIFKIKPTIATALSLPEVAAQKVYEITNDETTGMQKVVNADDERGLPIVFFQGKLSAPQIFSSGNFALVQSDTEAYMIDARNKQKTLIGEAFQAIEDASFSNSGKYLLVAEEGRPNFLLINTDNNKSREIELEKTSVSAWISAEQLVFATSQSYMNTTEADIAGTDYISLTTEKLDSAFTFGFFDPEQDRYKLVDEFSEISELPSEFIPLGNGAAIYFRSGEGLHKIILENF